MSSLLARLNKEFGCRSPVSQRMLALSSTGSGDEGCHVVGGVPVKRSAGPVVAQRSTLAAVRHAYRAGEFDSGFIHMDVRALLEDKTEAGLPGEDDSDVGNSSSRHFEEHQCGAAIRKVSRWHQAEWAWPP